MSRLITIVAALAVASGCGLIKIKGLPGGGSSKSTASGAKASSGGAKAKASGVRPTERAEPNSAEAPPPPGAHVKLEPGFSPNPRRVEMVGTTMLHTDKLGVKDDCSGYVLPSPVTLEASQDFKRLSLVVPSHVDVLVLKTADGKYYCDKPTTSMTNPKVIANLQAGEYKIYIGSRSRKLNYDVKLRIEDLAAPATLDWLADKRPTIKLSGNPSKLELRQRRYSKAIAASRAERHGPRFCKGSSKEYPKSPDLELDVSKRSTFVLGVRAAASTQIALLGPLTADNRDMTIQCVQSGSKLTLEPGRYFVRLGVKRDHAPTFANYYLMPVDAKVPVLTKLAPAPGKALQVAERSVMHHYPFLSNGDIYQRDTVRRQLFLDVDPGLFVSTRVDLDQHTAKAVVVFGIHSGSDTFLDPKAAFDYPLADEPLLLLGGDRVLAADGSIYSVQFKDLQPAEASAKLAIPSKVRNPQLYFQHAIKLAGADDGKRIAKRKARWDRYASCRDRVWKGVERRLERLRDYPYANRHKIDRVVSHTRGKVYRSCKKKALDASERVVWQELEVSRTKRRGVALETIRQRLLTLPK